MCEKGLQSNQQSQQQQPQLQLQNIQEYYQPSLVREKLKLPENYHEFKIKNRQQKV